MGFYGYRLGCRPPLVPIFVLNIETILTYKIICQALFADHDLPTIYYWKGRALSANNDLFYTLLICRSLQTLQRSTYKIQSSTWKIVYRWLLLTHANTCGGYWKDCYSQVGQNRGKGINSLWNTIMGLTSFQMHFSIPEWISKSGYARALRVGLAGWPW